MSVSAVHNGLPDVVVRGFWPVIKIICYEILRPVISPRCGPCVSLVVPVNRVYRPLLLLATSRRVAISEWVGGAAAEGTYYRSDSKINRDKIPWVNTS